MSRQSCGETTSQRNSEPNCNVMGFLRCIKPFRFTPVIADSKMLRGVGGTSALDSHLHIDGSLITSTTSIPNNMDDGYISDCNSYSITEEQGSKEDSRSFPRGACKN